MPIYEYVCEKCGGHLEVTQKMTDAPLTTHNIESDCGGLLKKIISMNAFHLKGTGWYKTDYAKPSSTGSAPSSASSSASSNNGSSDTSSTSSESKKESSESKNPASESSYTPTPAAKTGAGGTD